MAWTYQAGRKDKGEEKCPNLGRLSQPDLLMDWTQGVRERSQRWFLWFWPPQLSHMKLSCSGLKESIFPISFLDFLLRYLLYAFPFLLLLPSHYHRTYLCYFLRLCFSLYSLLFLSFIELYLECTLNSCSQP